MIIAIPRRFNSRLTTQNSKLIGCRGLTLGDRFSCPEGKPLDRENLQVNTPRFRWGVDTVPTDLLTVGRRAKAAARRLAGLGTGVKNQALLAMAEALPARQHEILEANEEDLRAARAGGLTGYILDRLSLTPQRLAGDRQRRAQRRLTAGPDRPGLRAAPAGQRSYAWGRRGCRWA